MADCLICPGDLPLCVSCPCRLVPPYRYHCCSSFWPKLTCTQFVRYVLYTYTCIVCIHIYIYIKTYVYIYIYTYIHMYRERESITYMCICTVCVYTYTYICACMYIYIYIYIYIGIHQRGFLAQPPRKQINTSFSLFVIFNIHKHNDHFQHMIPHRSNWCLIQRLATQVIIITLHDTTELQHVHNPTNA